MAKYSVNTDVLQSKASDLQTLQQGLNSVVLVLTAMQISDALKVSTSSILKRSIRECKNSVSDQVGDIQKLQVCLSAISEQYSKTEKKLLEPKTPVQAQIGSIVEQIENLIDSWPSIIMGNWWPAISGGWANVVISNWQERWPYITQLGVSAVLGVCATNDTDGGFLDDWSLLRGNVGLNTVINGIGCAGSLGFSLLGYETDSIGKANWDMGKGNIGMEYGGKISGHLLQLNSSSQIGIMNGKTQLNVGYAELSGKINASLFEDGYFCPSIGVGAKGKVSVLQGKAERYVGNEDYNLHIKGNGSVLGAEAKADVGVGRIIYQDPDTDQMREMYGLKAEVGAEAYIAEGKVSGGFTFMGIDVDASISGKYGGGGVEAGGYVGVDGFSGEIGAGLGLGAGVEITVDWSDFDPPTLEEIGQGIYDVGQSIGEGIRDVGQSIGEGIQDFGESIQNAGEAISDFFNW